MADSASSTGGAAAPEHAIRVRSYCQGIGDCHLLSFPRAGQADFTILIDCGIHGSIPNGGKIVANIAADLVKASGGHIDVLVVTHEHIDHTSGFHTANAVFRQIEFDQVWMAWTEDENDKQAQNLDRYKGSALAALTATSQHLAGVAGDPYVEALKTGIDGLLGFHFGAQGDTSRTARNDAKALGKSVLYLDPAHGPLDIPAASPVRAYVLGPSRDESYLKITDRASEMYGLAGLSAELWSAASPFAAGAMSPDASEFDGTTPFDADIGESFAAALDRSKAGTAKPDSLERFLSDHYCGPVRVGRSTSGPVDTDQSWRRIDYDWASSGADLALQLDSKTNNTSLVLAFEVAGSGRVFLFTADAQIGNWLSWQTVSWQVDGKLVTGPDLLARTVYLKVGHHGSQNATAEGKGLELMTSPDLTAFIPTNENDALNVKWGAMPFSKIVERLTVMTRGRLVRADDPWPLTPKAQWPPAFRSPSGCLVDTTSETFPDPDTGAPRTLYVEFLLN